MNWHFSFILQTWEEKMNGEYKSKNFSQRIEEVQKIEEELIKNDSFFVEMVLETEKIDLRSLKRFVVSRHSFQIIESIENWLVDMKIYSF